jgi:hypothetical protein
MIEKYTFQQDLSDISVPNENYMYIGVHLQNVSRDNVNKSKYEKFLKGPGMTIGFNGDDVIFLSNEKRR